MPFHGSDPLSPPSYGQGHASRHPLDLDLVRLFFGLGEIVGRLHARLGLGTAAEGLIEPDHHLRGDPGLAVDQVVERLA